MGRRSAISRLDPELRELVDRLIREGRATIRDIVDALEEELGEDAPSQSSVGRYVKNAREQLQAFREAQEVAKVWATKLEEDDASDLGQLVKQMLRTVAFQQVSQFAGEEGATPKEVKMLAGALRDLDQADKLALERVLKARQETARLAAEKAESVAKKGGMPQSVVDELRREILGVAG